MLLLPREGQPGKPLKERQLVPVFLGLAGRGCRSQAQAPGSLEGAVFQASATRLCGPRSRPEQKARH